MINPRKIEISSLFLFTMVVRPGESLTEDEVIHYCREKLAVYKVPKVISFIETLPKSAVGKVLRRELRAMEAGQDKS